MKLEVGQGILKLFQPMITHYSTERVSVKHAECKQKLCLQENSTGHLKTY